MCPQISERWSKETNIFLFKQFLPLLAVVSDSIVYDSLACVWFATHLGLFLLLLENVVEEVPVGRQAPENSLLPLRRTRS